MPDSYFDRTATADLELLRADVREHEELRRVATQVEQEIIDWYRVHPNQAWAGTLDITYTPNGRAFVVALEGYDEDPAKADGYDPDRAEWFGLAAALRETIADVTSHRLRFLDTDRTVTQEWRGKRKISRDSGMDPDWPNYWSDRLDRYDLRRKTVF